jgi:hypothetical protein
MARDGQLPRFLARVSPSHRVPERALLLVAAISLVVGVYMTTRDDAITLLSTLVNFRGAHRLPAPPRGGGQPLRAPPPARVQRAQARRRAGCGLVIIGYVIVRANVAAQTLGVAWLGLGVVVLVLFYVTGRRPALAGLEHDALEGSRT